MWVESLFEFNFFDEPSFSENLESRIGVRILAGQGRGCDGRGRWDFLQEGARSFLTGREQGVCITF